MTVKKVLVTGAGGQTGHNAIQCLHEHSGTIEVCAGIHKTDQEKQKAALAKFKVTTCELEAEDKSKLVDKFKDVQDLYVIPPSSEEKVQCACNYIDAAKDAGVRFVLLLSNFKADRKDYFWGESFLKIEEHLKKSGIPSWTIIRANFYAQNLLLYKEQINAGELPLPTADGKFAPIDVNDIGKAASSILVDSSKHHNRVYTLTGPEAVDGFGIAATLSVIFGREIKYRNISKDDARKILQSQNVPEIEIRSLLSYYELVQNNMAADVTDDFMQLTGRPPKSMRQFCEAHKSEFA